MSDLFPKVDGVDDVDRVDTGAPFVPLCLCTFVPSSQFPTKK